jgi:hypothetical protein
MNNRAAKARAILRMQRHPRPHPPGGWFCPIRRYHGPLVEGVRLFELEIGTWEGFQFITSPALDVLRL